MVTLDGQKEEKKKEEKPQIRGTPYSSLSIGVPKEIKEGERRVSQTPSTVSQLSKLGFNMFVEEGAGIASNFSDDDYKAAGAKIVSAKEVRCPFCFMFQIYTYILLL